MRTETKRLPIPDADSRPFWEGCSRGELLLQQCDACGHYRHPPNPVCPECLSTDATWTPASGRGAVYTFSVVHQALDPAWAEDVPYVVAVIELAEGPHMVSNIINTAPEQVRIGLSVQVVFERASDDVSLAKFQPLGE